MNHSCKVVTFGNFKGGTGKTTNSTMIAYCLSKLGYRVLLSDQDPQANATSLFLRTKARLDGEIVSFDTTLISAIQNRDLRSVVTPIKENLDILPSASDFSLYPLLLEKLFPSTIDRVQFFSTLLEPLKEDYDFIFIDVPPTFSIITDSALFASEYVVVVLQTHERSLQGADVFTNYLQTLIDNYDADLDVLGILPVLLKNQAAVDIQTLERATKMFGDDNLFKGVVKNMERLKRFDITGIAEEDMHDRNVILKYMDVTYEFLERLKSKADPNDFPVPRGNVEEIGVTTSPVLLGGIDELRQLVQKIVPSVDVLDAQSAVDALLGRLRRASNSGDFSAMELAADEFLEKLRVIAPSSELEPVHQVTSKLVIDLHENFVQIADKELSVDG